MQGMRFEITKPLNQNFFLSHSLFMGNMELGTGGRQVCGVKVAGCLATWSQKHLYMCLSSNHLLTLQVLKAPVGTYEFGANVVSEKFMMLGRIATDGRLSGRLKYDVLDWLGVKLHMQLSNEPGQSQVMVDSDVKGGDWNAQLKLGSPSFLGLNYFQVRS